MKAKTLLAALAVATWMLSCERLEAQQSPPPEPSTDPLEPIERLARGWWGRGGIIDRWRLQQGPIYGAPAYGGPVYVPEEGAVFLDEPYANSYSDPSFESYPGYEGVWGGDRCCAPLLWAHRHSVFGEYLFLRPRDAEVVYAAPVDGAVTPPGNPSRPGNEVGRLGMLDPDYESAFRVGFWWALSDCASLGAAYTRYESETGETIETSPPPYIQSLVTHPGVLNAEDNWQIATAQLDVDFQLLDIDYRWLMAHADRYAVNALGGVRLGELEQAFRSTFLINGSRTVRTDVDFEGAGIMLGLDATRFAPCSGWLVYGKGGVSFLAGETTADFRQGSSFAASEINTTWEAARLVTVLELELGVGWRSRCDRLRLSAGYAYSSWLNVVATDEFIDAVNANSFAGLGGDTITFDGLVARAEWRF